MENTVQKFLFGSFFVFSSMAYADALVARLNKINLEADQVEIYAANCAIEASESNTINDDCTMTNDLLDNLKQKLARLIAKNIDRAEDEEVLRYVKTIDIKLDKANSHLTDAKIVTGDYQWTSSVIPAIHQK